MASEYGELATTPFINNSTACNSTIDGYINFPPVGAYAQFDFQFLIQNIPEDLGIQYNSYAKREVFGIIAADIKVIKYDKTGRSVLVTSDFNVRPIYNIYICIYLDYENSKTSILK